MYDDDERRAAPGDLVNMTGALPVPWDGDHNIDYWNWDGTRLVPAPAEERDWTYDERTFAAQCAAAGATTPEREAHGPDSPGGGSAVSKALTVRPRHLAG